MSSPHPGRALLVAIVGGVVMAGAVMLAVGLAMLWFQL